MRRKKKKKKVSSTAVSLQLPALWIQILQILKLGTVLKTLFIFFNECSASWGGQAPFILGLAPTFVELSVQSL